MSFASLCFSRVSHLPRSRGCTSAHQRCIYTHTLTCPPPFFEVSPSIFLILLFLSPLFSEHPPFVPPVNFLAFSLRISIYSPLLTSLDQVSRTKSYRKKEREGRRKRGLNYLPHRPPASPPLSSPLPSQSVFTPIPRQHHRRAHDLRVEHPSVFNAAPLTRALSFRPFIFVTPLLPFSFLSLSPPPLPHFTLQTLGISISLNRILASISPPLSNSPLPLSRSEHVRPRVRARVPPRTCRGRVKPCV